MKVLLTSLYTISEFTQMRIDEITDTRYYENTVADSSALIYTYPMIRETMENGKNRN